MNKTEKKFKKYIEKNLPVKDTFQDICKRIDFEGEEKTMNKKVLFPLLGGGAAAIAVAAVVIGTMGMKPNVDPKARAIVSVDVNPSIELVVDDENTVISVTGLNDDGKMVISGEKIVGENLDKALEIIIQAEKDTGFLISGKVKDGENEIKISVSGETEEIISEVQEAARASIALTCENLKIDETIKNVEKYTREVIEAKVLEIDPSLEETVSEMTYEELLNVIKVYQLETSKIYSLQLEQLYNEAKAYDISFAEKESINTLISDVDSVYQSFVQAYGSLISSLEGVITSLEETRYSIFVSEESEYQKALVEVSAAKDELNVLRQEVAEMEDGIDKTIKEVELGVKETALTAVQSGLDIVETAANAAIDTAKSAVETVITSLKEKEASFPEEIQSILKDKVTDIETKVNETKDQAFADFEAKYGEDIERINQEVAARKQALIDSLKSEQA